MVLRNRETEVYEFGPFRLDVAERLLTREGAPLPLAPKVFDTLVALARGGGRLLTKDELMAELWPDTAVEEANLIVNISALRRALGDGGGARYIETVPRRGYRLAAGVRSFRGDEEPDARAQAGATPGREKGGTPGREEGAGGSAPPSAGGVPAPSAGGVPAPSAVGDGARGLIMPAACALAFACLSLVFYVAAGRRGAAENRFQRMRIERLTSAGNVAGASLSPDGNYVVYALAEGDGRGLWVRQVTGSNAVRIVPPAPGVQFRGLTFSPDGKYVFYVAAEGAGAGALYRVPALGGPVHHVLSDVNRPVSFSPDGRRFAFLRHDAARGESTVLVAATGGRIERALATRREPASYQWLAWSPDGRSIACSARDADAGGEYSSIVELSLGDGAERPLSAKRWYWAGQLAWLADAGGLIVAATDQGVGMWNQVWEVRRGGAEARRITNDLNSYVGLSLSADSATLLAVVADRVSNIWVAPLGGGPPRQVTSTKYDGYWGLAWAADGRLVYESSSGSQIQFWVAAADGTAPRQLTDDPHPKALPSVSRDARHIVYASARAGPMNLWRIGPDGGDPRQLTFGREGDAFPACSPDAAWVVYESRHVGVPTLWRVPLGGGAPVQLTSTPGSAPAVSPDGQYIAYWEGEAAGGAAVAIIRSGGGEPVQRLRVNASAVGDRRALRWVPTGEGLSYVETRAGVSNVWSVPLAGGGARRLTDFRSELIFDFDWSPDGRSLALSRGHFTRDLVIISDLGPTRRR